MAIWQASFEESETFMKKKKSQTFRDPYITQTLQLWNYQRKLTISYVRPKGRSCWARRLLFQPCHSTHWLIYQSATKERYSTKLRCISCKYTSLVFFPITRMMQLIHSVTDCQHWSTVFGRHFAANAGKSFFSVLCFINNSFGESTAWPKTFTLWIVKFPHPYSVVHEDKTTPGSQRGLGIYQMRSRSPRLNTQWSKALKAWER